MHCLFTIFTISLGLLSSATPSSPYDLPSPKQWTVFYDKDFFGYYNSMNRYHGIGSAKLCSEIASAHKMAMMAVWDIHTKMCKTTATYPHTSALMYIPTTDNTDPVPFSMGYTITGTYSKKARSDDFKNRVLNEKNWAAECDAVSVMTKDGESYHYCEKFSGALGRIIMLPTSKIDTDPIAANPELPSPADWITFRNKGMFEEYSGVTKYEEIGSAKSCADIASANNQLKMAVWKASTKTCKLKDTYPHRGSSLHVSSDTFPSAQGYAFMGNTMKVAQSDSFNGVVRKEKDWAEPCDVVLKISEDGVAYQICKSFDVVEGSILMLPRK